jgi:hypothetical protein
MSNTSISLSETTFKTSDLPFAAFLFSTQKLEFLGCEVAAGTSRIEFIFQDNQGEGEKLHLSFETGAKCAAASYYDAVRHLRRAMTRTQNNGTKEHEHVDGRNQSRS